MDLDVVVECGGFVSWWCRVRHGLTCASDDVTDCHTDHQERRHRPSDVGSGPSDVGTAAAPSWAGYVDRTGSRPPPRRHVVMGCGHGPTAGFRRRHLVAALVAVGQVGGCSVGHRVSATDRRHWSATMVAGSRRTDGVRSIRGHSGRRRRMQQTAASSSRRRPAAAAAASLLIHLQPVLRLLLTPPAAVSFRVAHPPLPLSTELVVPDHALLQDLCGRDPLFPSPHADSCTAALGSHCSPCCGDVGTFPVHLRVLHGVARGAAKRASGPQRLCAVMLVSGPALRSCPRGSAGFVLVVAFFSPAAAAAAAVSVSVMSVLLYEWVAASSAVGCCGHPGPQVLVHLLAVGGAAGGAAGRRSSCSAHE
jgi:hypothetical protein